MQHYQRAARKKENFPVAPWLLPRAQRKAIVVFYDYVRGLDEIADDVARLPQERHQALKNLRKGEAARWVLAYDGACQSGLIAPEHGAQMLKAFVRDTQQTRYESYADLLDYCRYSAVPVGRFLLQLWGEKQADLDANDALCSLLQILNHLQDVQQDYQQLDRVYLPKQYMQQTGATEAMLNAPNSAPELRRAMHLLHEDCEALLSKAQRLPVSLNQRRMRWQAAWVVGVAGRLLKRLKAQDPLAQRVQLPRRSYLAALFSALAGAYAHGD